MHIIWVVLGLLGAVWIFWENNKKGGDVQSSLPWAIGALLVPAVVIPLYFLQKIFRTRYEKAKGHGREPRDITSDVVHSCPHCGQFYGGSLKSCPYCKRNVNEDE